MDTIIWWNQSYIQYNILADTISYGESYRKMDQTILNWLILNETRVGLFFVKRVWKLQIKKLEYNKIVLQQIR